MNVLTKQFEQAIAYDDYHETRFNGNEQLNKPRKEGYPMEAETRNEPPDATQALFLCTKLRRNPQKEFKR